MISIGEESGELVKMLNHCGHYYESILSKYIARFRATIRTCTINCHGHWCSRISRFCYVSLIYIYRQTRRTIDIILPVLNRIGIVLHNVKGGYYEFCYAPSSWIKS